MSRRRFAAAALLAALAGGLFAVGATVLRPQTLGGEAGYVIVAGESMEPGLSADDLVIVRQRAAYEPGDVIAYRIPNGSSDATVIHRVIGGNAEDGYVTQGDNRETRDVWRPRPSDVIGARWVRIPAVGKAVRLFRTPIGLSAVVGFTVFAFFALAPRGEARRPTPTPRRQASLAARG